MRLTIDSGILQRLGGALLAEEATRLAPGAEDDRLVAGFEAEFLDGGRANCHGPAE